MTTRYPGGLIRKTPPTITPPVDGEGGSAPGVWTLEQASYYTKQGTWPKPVIPRSTYLWGNNSSGQLGQNDTVARSSPVQLGSETYWSQVSVGWSFFCAIKNDGTLWSWGRNDQGQLGHNNVINKSSPVQIGSLTNWKTVAAGVAHSLAVKTDGTLWAWGNNASGRLGNNDVQPQSSPIQIGALDTWLKVSCAYQSAAIKTDGTLWSWGNNFWGQLGHDDTLSKSSPTQVGLLTTWSLISVSPYASMVATKTNLTLSTWGRNYYGQLGLGNTTNQSSPTQVGALTTWTYPLGGYDWTLVLKNDNTIWCCGRNNYGQFGTNSTSGTANPNLTQGAASSSDWGSVGIGSRTAFGIKTDGTLWGWGQNNSGSLGDNSGESRSSPVQISSNTNWSSIDGGLAESGGIILG